MIASFSENSIQMHSAVWPKFGFLQKIFVKFHKIKKKALKNQELYLKPWNHFRVYIAYIAFFFEKLIRIGTVEYFELSKFSKISDAFSGKNYINDDSVQ